jgi:hypothetical protein
MLLLVYALAFLGFRYGSGSGAAQRGPDSFDCIGFVRWVLRAVAPELWPGNAGGEDSWTVPNFIEWVSKLGLFDILPASAELKAGDVLIFGSNDHIGFGDGAGRCVSALNPKAGVCSVLISAMTLPLTMVLRTRKDLGMETPIGIARVGIDPDIRAIRPDGSLVPAPLGSDVPVYATGNLTGEHPGPAYRVLIGGSIAWVLARNATWYPMSGSDLAATLQGKIDAAKVALA